MLLKSIPGKPTFLALATLVAGALRAITNVRLCPHGFTEYQYFDLTTSQADYLSIHLSIFSTVSSPFTNKNWRSLDQPCHGVP